MHKLLSLALGGMFAAVANASEPAISISIMPGFNYSSFGRHTPAVAAFRERLTAVLVEDYACHVVSRSYGLVLAHEHALANLQKRGEGLRLIPAAWVVTPILAVGEEDPLVWHLSMVRTDTDPVEIHRHQIPIQTTQAEDEDIAVQAAHELAARIGMSRRTTPDAGPLRDRRITVAVMPGASPPRTPEPIASFPVGEMIEHRLQAEGIDTVARRQFQHLLSEQVMAHLLNSTEQFAGDLGRMIGASILLRPVLLATPEDQMRVVIHIIDTETGALVGVFERLFQDPHALRDGMPGFVAALLDHSVLTPDPAAFPDAWLASEASYHIQAVDMSRDTADRAYTAVLEGGLEHARAAYALARSDAKRLDRLLRSMNSQLIREPEELAGVYSTPKYRWPNYRLSPEYRRGVGELMDEIMDQLQSLRAGPRLESYYRMRAAYIRGDYRDALRYAGMRGAGSPRTIQRHRARFHFLLGEYNRAVAALRPGVARYLDAPGVGRNDALDRQAQWDLYLLARCYARLDRPLDEMRALEISGHTYGDSADHRNRAIRLMQLMLDHLTPSERLERRNAFRGAGIDIRPEGYYFWGRTWEEAGAPEKALRAYRQMDRTATYIRHINPFTGQLFSDTSSDRIGRLESFEPPPGKRAADIHTIPDSLRIYIQPVEDLDPEGLRLMAHWVQWFYGVETVVLPPIPLPMFHPIYEETRNQFNADRWATVLLHSYPVPEDAYHMVVLTSENIYTPRGGYSFVHTHTWRSSGTICSDYRFRLFYRGNYVRPWGTGNFAKVMARVIVNSQKTMWQHLVPESAIEEITGSTVWPNAPDCVTFSNWSVDGFLSSSGVSLAVSGFAYGPEVA